MKSWKSSADRIVLNSDILDHLNPETTCGGMPPAECKPVGGRGYRLNALNAVTNVAQVGPRECP
jgi:hypothetical protein